MLTWNLTERGIAFTAFSELWQYRTRHCVLLELISIAGSIRGWPDVHSQNKTPISGCQDCKSDRTTMCKESQIVLVLQKLLQLLGSSCAKGSNNIRKVACMSSVVFVFERVWFCSQTYCRFPFWSRSKYAGFFKVPLTVTSPLQFTICKVELINNDIVKVTVWNTQERTRINNQAS